MRKKVALKPLKKKPAAKRVVAKKRALPKIEEGDIYTMPCGSTIGITLLPKEVDEKYTCLGVQIRDSSGALSAPQRDQYDSFPAPNDRNAPTNSLNCVRIFMRAYQLPFVIQLLRRMQKQIKFERGLLYKP